MSGAGAAGAIAGVNAAKAEQEKFESDMNSFAQAYKQTYGIPAVESFREGAKWARQWHINKDRQAAAGILICLFGMFFVIVFVAIVMALFS